MEPEYRYTDLTGKATLTRISEFIIVFLHDEKINPKRQILKFRAPLKGNPTPPNPDENTTIIADINFIAGLDEPWFDQTIKNGFQFRKEDGSPVLVFTDLEAPAPEEKDKMNPIEP